MGKIWAIASGSGGVGKTTIALALAVGAAHKGLKTILLDASGITRSCDLLLGIESTMTVDLIDAISDQIDIGAALYPVAQCKELYLTNVSLHDHASLSDFSGIILALQSMCDVLVIDLPSGEVSLETNMLTIQDELIFVLRPDDASIRSTERLMQQMRGCNAGIFLLLNRIRKERVKKGLQYAHEAVSMMLDCPLLGMLAEDEACVLDIGAGKAVQAVTRLGSPVKDMLAKLLQR